MNIFPQHGHKAFEPPEAESAYDVQLLENVARSGMHIVHVNEEDGMPPFAYTLGHYARSMLPEVLVFGLPAPVAHRVLIAVAIHHRGHRSAYETFQRYEGLAQGYPVMFVPVGKSHYPRYLGYAGWFYQSIGADFPAQQMVWPDPSGRFPWEDGYDEAFAARQPLLVE